MTPVVANFHGLGEPHAWTDSAEQLYWLAPDQFRRALDLLQAAGHGMTVTFDDGNLSDFELGMPACAERGIPAVCFVCTGRIGKPGYLTAAQLRQMAGWPGCSIGSHGRDHVVWNRLDDDSLAAESKGSRETLEDVLGRPVTDLGLPFGAYDSRVLAAARSAGYVCIFSSDGAPRLSSRGVIPRLSFRNDRPVAQQVQGLAARATRPHALIQEARLRLRLLR